MPATEDDAKTNEQSGAGALGLNGVWFRLLVSLVPLYVGLGWLLWNHSMRITVLETSQFTQSEGQKMAGRIQEVKLQIAALPQELPPKWFVTRVDLLDARLKTIEELASFLYMEATAKTKPQPKPTRGE